MASSGEKKAAVAEDAKSAPAATQNEACDLLCSLGEQGQSADEAFAELAATTCEKKGKKGKACAKQHQLPMFLSSKYCDDSSCLPRSSCSRGVKSRCCSKNNDMVCFGGMCDCCNYFLLHGLSITSYSQSPYRCSLMFLLAHSFSFCQKPIMYVFVRQAVVSVHPAFAEAHGVFHFLCFR